MGCTLALLSSVALPQSVSSACSDKWALTKVQPVRLRTCCLCPEQLGNAGLASARPQQFLLAAIKATWA